MKEYQDKFIEFLNNLDKDGAVTYGTDLVRKENLPITTLYEDVIGPALSQIAVEEGNESTAIWKEHLKTNIVRCIIEGLHKEVMEANRQAKRGGRKLKVMILSPEEEYHEIGPRMGADFFTMLGDEVYFIGCNTPIETCLAAYQELKPDLIVISVTNFLNLVTLKKIVLSLRKQVSEMTKIVISGSALKRTGHDASDFGADGVVLSMKEIEAYREGLK